MRIITLLALVLLLLGIGCASTRADKELTAKIGHASFVDLIVEYGGPYQTTVTENYLIGEFRAKNGRPFKCAFDRKTLILKSWSWLSSLSAGTVRKKYPAGPGDRGYKGGFLRGGLLGPYKPDAYGPGIWSDGTGRAFEWRTRDGESTGIFHVEPDAYGPGVGMDEFGRPVYPTPLW